LTLTGGRDRESTEVKTHFVRVQRWTTKTPVKKGKTAGIIKGNPTDDGKTRLEIGEYNKEGCDAVATGPFENIQRTRTEKHRFTGSFFGKLRVQVSR